MTFGTRHGILVRNFMKPRASLLVKEEINDDELEQCIVQAKTGDAEALERLCTYAYARLYPYIYYRVSHTEDAEDLTSEVVLKMVKALRNQKGSFRAWMYTIARNAVIDFYRKRAVRSEVSISGMSRDLPDGSRPVSDQVLTHERLRSGLRELTEDQRRVVLLKFIEGYTNDEIARIMAKTVGAVKLLQFRAVKALREFFRKKGYEA